MSLLYGHNERVARFVASIIWQGQQEFSNPVAIGVTSNGALIGGVVYHNWEPEAQIIEMSAASTTPRWLNRSIIHALLEYPFGQLGCQMVIMRVSERNKRALKLNLGIGFRPQKVRRLYGRKHDGYLLTMTDDEWKQSRFYQGD